MKTVTIRGIMADFLDSIRAYEHESGEGIHFDKRESSEFVDMYFNGGGKLKIEEQKPLFITEDGVEIFVGDSYVIVEEDFKKHRLIAHNLPYTEDFKKFKHESNADKYIWKNKPLFSYEDFMRWGNVPYERVIKKLAKERASEK